MQPLRKALGWILVGLATLAGLVFATTLIVVLWGDPVFAHGPDLSPEALAATGIDFRQPYAAEARQFVMADGIELAGHVFPSESPSTIVLVHGALSSSYPLNSAAGLLREATGARVVTLDLRGHGASGGRPGDVDHIGQYEEDLGEVVRQLRTDPATERVILAGHSMGGGIALRYAEAPGLPPVDGYLLFAPYLGWDSPTTPKTASVDSADFLKIHLGRILGLKLLNAAGIQSFNGLRVQFFNLPPELPLRSYSYRATESQSPADYRAALAALEAPLLVVVGADDQAFIASNYPDVVGTSGHVVIVPAAGHETVLRAADGLAAVGEWLGRLPAGRSR